ncbi:MAG: cell division protein FtsQ/DivIB [Candidatus Methylumidiphilus sp.]
MANIRNQPRAGVTRGKGYSSKRGKRGRSFKLGQKLLKLALLLALAGLGWAAWERIKPELGPGPLFPIAFVRVEGGIENLDLAKLNEALRPVVGGGYFSLDMAGIEGAVRSFAWVDGVRFARVWPDTLEITLSEHKAVARWGDRALLNPKGMRFTPDGIDAFAFLPVIYGPPGMEASLLEVLKNLNERLAPLGASVASLDVSKRRAWIVRLNNGLEMHFGRQDPVKLMDRFLALVPKLGEESFSRLKTVDLRYPNGFAVVWKPLEEIENKNDSGMGPQPNGMASNLALEKQ